MALSTLILVWAESMLGFSLSSSCSASDGTSRTWRPRASSPTRPPHTSAGGCWGFLGPRLGLASLALTGRLHALREGDARPGAGLALAPVLWIGLAHRRPPRCSICLMRVFATSAAGEPPVRLFLQMKTYTAKPGEIEREWFLVDAEGQTLGRLATRIADAPRQGQAAVHAAWTRATSSSS